MSDDLPPYEGQNWLCLTDAEVQQWATGELSLALVEKLRDKVRRLKEALDKRLAERAQLPPAEVITARTDRGGLEQP